jgi:hypothetical protein
MQNSLFKFLFQETNLERLMREMGKGLEGAAERILGTKEGRGDRETEENMFKGIKCSPGRWEARNAGVVRKRDF